MLSILNRRNAKNTILKVLQQTSANNEDSAAYQKKELNMNAPKLYSNNSNTRKNEEKEITPEMLKEMKTYFSNFFSATTSVIKEIFSVKNNTIQHPIYAFRGGCFICNESSVAHLKDERGDIFLEKRKIKLIKNANIFKLLNESMAYLEDEDYLTENNLNNESNEGLESEYYDDGNEFNQENYDSQENIEDEFNLNINGNNKKYRENFVSSSYFSDSNFEFAKENFRVEKINCKEIKAEIEAEILNLEEIQSNNIGKNRYNVNNNLQEQRAGISTFSNNSRGKSNSHKFNFLPPLSKSDAINSNTVNLSLTEEDKLTNNDRNKFDKNFRREMNFGNNNDLNLIRSFHNDYDRKRFDNNEVINEKSPILEAADKDYNTSKQVKYDHSIGIINEENSILSENKEKKSIVEAKDIYLDMKKSSRTPLTVKVLPKSQMSLTDLHSENKIKNMSQFPSISKRNSVIGNKYPNK